MFRTTATAAIFAVALGGSAFAQQEGLVNVNVENVSALNDVVDAVVQVPVGIAANVCPDVDVLTFKGTSDVACTVEDANSSEALVNFVQNSQSTQGSDNRGGGTENAPGQAKK